MIIKNLTINNLRNHKQTEIELNDKINIFYGKNGVGKTTILEALSILSISKSFLPTNDSILISNEEKYYLLKCEAINDLTVPYWIKIQFNLNGKKIINSSLGDNLLPKNIIGEIPSIILSPDFKIITFGSPQDRRQFLDTVLSQSSKIYIDEALKIKRLLKQRNIILSEYTKTKEIDSNLFETITEMFINSASEIIHRRSKFINEFVEIFENYYKIVSDENEKCTLHYIPNILNNQNNSIIEKQKIRDEYTYYFSKNIDRELSRGMTLFGPQKDDIEFRISGNIAKEAASQGQHKSILLSLKFAEFELLRRLKKENPIMMLDDIFSELDIERSRNINQIISKLDCQTFITITNRDRFDTFNKIETNLAYYRLENGKIIGE